ncbi:RNA methyltransferase [Undibacterium sp. LX40W]|uniref:RNA methyltransferase n=1 Tax=Undibacterium nitidum TaxID=2762298 RepID=A0A923HU17_9BURK|nr:MULTISPECIES: RNA methyltransferase [Undibacterium]MBC3880076.1 RNA methyltransferase [Undibacterium nitidum]MBC3891188.1 RNA methyltransferase [Undibacterium sp. LX40W]
MKQITSRDNALFKELKHLATNANARRKSGKTLLDGAHLCQAYLQHRGGPELCIVSESSLQNSEVQQIIAECEKQNAKVVALPDSLYQAISQVDNGVGLVFVANAPSATIAGPLALDAVLLDGLQDPGNLGSILRSAAAAGIKQVYCGEGTASAWSPKVLRAGMGAHFLLEIFESVDLQTLIKESSIPVFATSSHTTTNIYQANLTQPLAWLFGHEGQGVSQNLMALAHAVVTIPQRAEIESLNVAASGAICFFEQVRQRLK